MSTWLLGLSASVLSLAGIAGLFHSWRQRSPKALWARRSGWVLLALSVVLWVWAHNPEFGVTFGLFVPALGAWLIIAASADSRPSNGGAQTQPKQRLKLPGLGPFAKQLLIFVLAIPLAAVATALVSIAVTDWLPWQRVNSLPLGILLMPVLWGLASYWVCADQRLFRPTLTLIIAGLIAAAYLFL